MKKLVKKFEILEKQKMKMLRAFTMGLGYGKCKENLACEAQSSLTAGHGNM